MIIPLAFVYWAFFSRNKTTFVLIWTALVSVAVAIILFEIWYRAVMDGARFWTNYWSFQTGLSAESGFNPLRKLYNLIWYSGRILWFSAPWIYFLFFAFYISGKKKLHIIKDFWLRLSLYCAAAIVLLFSLSNRLTDRYIFPAYIFFAASGSWALMRIYPRIEHFLKQRQKWLPLYLSIILIVMTALSIYYNIYHYRFLSFWN